MNKELKKEQWNIWFAGLTDGDGCFYINRKEKSVSYELTTHISDARVVYDIKNKLKAGSVKLRSNSQSIRYRVKAKEVICDIVNRLNGRLFNPVRIAQFKEVCQLYGITPLVSQGLPENPSAYLAGLIDSDGTVTISTSKSSTQDSILKGSHGKITRLINSKGNNQISLKITTVYKDYAYFIKDFTGFGSVEKPNKSNKSPNTKYHWTVGSQQKDFELVYDYLKKYPLKSVKMHRIRLSSFYFKYKSLGYNLKPSGTVEAKMWSKLAQSWYKYSY